MEEPAGRRSRRRPIAAQRIHDLSGKHRLREQSNMDMEFAGQQF
jgi:hypothetical protein